MREAQRKNWIPAFAGMTHTSCSYIKAMDFTDEGILISAKPLGEANTIAELLTARHGRHLGLVRGGRSRRMRPLMQLGNRLSVTWRARLSDHLGGFNVEMLEPHAARVLDDQVALAAIGSLTGLAKHLPERDPHPQLYYGALEVLGALDDAQGLAGASRALGDAAAPGPRLRPRFERMRRDRDGRRPDLCLAEIGQGGFARRRPALLRPAVEAPALPA